MSRHTVFYQPEDLSDDRLTLRGPEAEHAVKSKRLRTDDEVTAIDGAGTRLTCRIERAGKKKLELVVVGREHMAAVAPAVHLCTATPKGPRLDKMIDAVSQAGAASWAPMATKLGVVDPGASKIERMRRIAVESAKQSMRSHLLELRRHSAFDRVVGVGGALVVADASGGPYLASGAGSITVLVGPEGGFVAEEMDAARAAGAQVVSLGPHVLRIETAAAVAVALVLAAERS